ncbi:MAG: TetR/AcrR family transcriptional regulator [Bacteroidota bacterium]
MPRTQKQFEGIREEKKALIMRTALELFATQGFHGTTISSIADKAEISKGLLYNYFNSKEDLLKAIIYAGLENIDKLVDPNKDGVLTGDEMEFLLDRYFKLLKNDSCFWRLYFTLLLQEPILELVEERLSKVINSYIDLLKSYFESQGREDPYTEAVIFGALLDGIGMNYLTYPEIFQTEKIKERILKKYS